MVTLAKMGRPSKNGTELKNRSRLEKWVPVEQMDQPWKNWWHLEKSVPAEKMGQP